MSIYHGMLFIYITTLLSLCSAQTSSSRFDPTQMCSLLANDTFIKDPRACNAWIQCVNGEPIAGKCVNEEFFDRNTNMCVPANSIDCISSDPCAATAGRKGFVPDPYSCNGYYYCNGNGNAAHGTCSPGMNFNPGTSDCIRNFPCTLPMDPNSYCNIVPDGVFIKDTTSCSSYELCWNNELLRGTCPGYFFFDSKTGTCTYPDDVECSEVITNPPGLDPALICPKVGAFVADNTTCNGYYYCKAPAKVGGIIELIWAKCPSGRFFDPTDGGSCIARTQITCTNDRCADMGLKHIQLANESSDNCVGYAICQNGAQIGSGICPDGEYFDEVTQFCTKRVISYPACVLSPNFSTTTTATTVSNNDEEAASG